MTKTAFLLLLEKGCATGETEDMADVLALNESVEVPYGLFLELGLHNGERLELIDIQFDNEAR